jgi:hypothetical protein
MIQDICEELVVEVNLEAARKERRSKMSVKKFPAKILEAIKNSPQGISQI